MKYPIYFLLLLLALSSCRKSDEKIEELIVGRWVRKCDPALFVGGCSNGSENFQVITFHNDGTVKHTDLYNEENNGSDFAFGTYFIKNGSILLNTINDDSGREFKLSIELKKISTRKLKISIEGSDVETYIK